MSSIRRLWKGNGCSRVYSSGNGTPSVIESWDRTPTPPTSSWDGTPSYLSSAYIFDKQVVDLRLKSFLVNLLFSKARKMMNFFRSTILLQTKVTYTAIGWRCQTLFLSPLGGISQIFSKRKEQQMRTHLQTMKTAFVGTLIDRMDVNPGHACILIRTGLRDQILGLMIPIIHGNNQLVPSLLAEEILFKWRNITRRMARSTHSGNRDP